MELFDHIFFDNEKLWIVLFLKDKRTLDTNTRHAARIYSLWECIYIRVCVSRLKQFADISEAKTKPRI